MKIEISGQNLNTGQSFKNYAEEKLQKSTNKYFERAILFACFVKKAEFLLNTVCPTKNNKNINKRFTYICKSFG